MPNDLPDWIQNASVPGQTITLVAGSPNSTTTVTLPNRASAVIVDVLGSGFTMVNVSGHTSAEPYLALASPVGGPRAALVTDSRDSQVDVFLAHVVGVTNHTVDISFMPSSVIAMLSAGSVVDVTDRPGRSLGNVQSIVNPIALSATPPLWQAPQAYASQELAAVGSVVMVAAVLGQTIRLFGWTIEIDQASAASIGWLEDTVSAAGTVSARVAAAASASNGGASGYEAGKPLTAGQGLRLNVPALGAGGVVRAVVGYSQG